MSSMPETERNACQVWEMINHSTTPITRQLHFSNRIPQRCTFRNILTQTIPEKYCFIERVPNMVIYINFGLAISTFSLEYTCGNLFMDLTNKRILNISIKYYWLCMLLPIHVFYNNTIRVKECLINKLYWNLTYFYIYTFPSYYARILNKNYCTYIPCT